MASAYGGVVDMPNDQDFAVIRRSGPPQDGEPFIALSTAERVVYGPRL